MRFSGLIVGAALLCSGAVQAATKVDVQYSLSVDQRTVVTANGGFTTDPTWAASERTGVLTLVVGPQFAEFKTFTGLSVDERRRRLTVAAASLAPDLRAEAQSFKPNKALEEVYGVEGDFLHFRVLWDDSPNPDIAARVLGIGFGAEFIHPDQPLEEGPFWRFSEGLTIITDLDLNAPFDVSDAMLAQHLAPGTVGFWNLNAVRTDGNPFAFHTNQVASSGVGYAGRFTITGLALTAVPEPATWAVMIGGFGLVGARLRRRLRLQSV